MGPAGHHLIDTADSYGPEVSENLIAEALHPYPHGLVIATKGRAAARRPGRAAEPQIELSPPEMEEIGSASRG
jgi:aryl-alcohol dehydrogenase-like predicted oxidoreductase